MLPSVDGASGASVIDGGASVKDGGASVIDDGASVIDGAASEKDGGAHRKCRLAHRSSGPNVFLKHFTETQKTRRTHTVLPSVTHVVVLNDGAFSVAQCEGVTARADNTPRRPRRPNAAHRIVCHVKKWQLEHCAA